jgi:hypothetical protein
VGVTAGPLDAVQVRRPGIVYAVDVLDHETNVVMRADYVGKSRRKLAVRAAEHREDQAWADLIVDDFYVLVQGMFTDAELAAEERAAIARYRPRLNFVDNVDNPDRIPKYVQWQQRWERDDRLGRPRWVHPDQRGTPAVVVSAVPVSLWKPWQVTVGVWMAVWVALSTLAWLLVEPAWSAVWPDGSWVWLPAVVLGSASTVAVAYRWYRRPRPRWLT